MNIQNYDAPPVFWDEMVSGSGLETGISQSSHRAAVLRKSKNIKPLFLHVQKEGRPISSLLVFHHKTELKLSQLGKTLRTLLLGRQNGYLQWRDGPIFHETNVPAILESLDLLITWLQNYGKGNGLYQIDGAFAHGSKHNKGDDISKWLEEQGFVCRKWGTLQVDLLRNKDVIWKSLKKSARKAVRKARKQQVSIRRIETLSELRTIYYQSYREFVGSSGQKANPFIRLQNVWESDTKNYYHFYVAVDSGNRILATLGMYCFNRVATEIASSLNPIAMRDKIPAQDLLHWEMMLAAKKLNCIIFDLAGVNPAPTQKKEKGIRQFKEKWSGDYKEFLRFKKRLLTS